MSSLAHVLVRTCLSAWTRTDNAWGAVCKGWWRKGDAAIAAAASTGAMRRMHRGDPQGLYKQVNACLPRGMGGAGCRNWGAALGSFFSGYPLLMCLLGETRREHQSGAEETWCHHNEMR